MRSQENTILPPIAAPVLLSERFKRSLRLRMEAHHRRKLKTVPKEPRVVKKVEPESKAEFTREAVIKVTNEPKKLGKGGSFVHISVPASAEPGKAKQDIELPTEEITFSPFKLGDFSSFNINKLSKNKLDRMDPLTRAKYQAYDKVEPAILEKVIESERRARIYLRQVRRENEMIIKEAKRQWDLLRNGPQHDEKNGAALAKKRIAQKIKMIEKTRVNQLI